MTKTTKTTVAPRRALRSDKRILEKVENDRIRQLAYQRFLARGASHGHDLDDWLAAEEELRSG